MIALISSNYDLRPNPIRTTGLTLTRGSRLLGMGSSFSAIKNPDLTMAPMEPMVTPRRRSRSEVEPDDEDAVVDFSSGRSKRARNGNHDHTNEDVETPSHGLQKEVLEPRGSRGAYQPGAIIRVKLKNFVTYTAVEFFPGPNLNMVIGPNGTGKSTLVCAICIGLGWGPQVKPLEMPCVRFY